MLEVDILINTDQIFFLLIKILLWISLILYHCCVFVRVCISSETTDNDDNDVTSPPHPNNPIFAPDANDVVQPGNIKI